VRDEVKAHKYFKKESVRKNHATFFAMADNNGDGKIDRWELYDYCVKNMKTE
jgi:Ca2+-binding EF-hand superfamily protein